MPSDSIKVKRFLHLMLNMSFLETESKGERVFERQIVAQENGKKLRTRAWVRIYSSIKGDKFRGEGEDAIRVVAVRRWENPEEEAPLAKTTRINRTENWAGVLKRVRERAKEMWKAGVARRKTAKRPSELAAEKERRENEPATAKQIRYYEDLSGTAVVGNYTKKQMSAMIDNARTKNGLPKSEQKKMGKRRYNRVPGNEITKSQFGYLEALTGVDYRKTAKELGLLRLEGSQMIDLCKKRESKIERRNALLAYFKKHKARIEGGKKARQSSFAF